MEKQYLTLCKSQGSQIFDLIFWLWLFPQEDVPEWLLESVYSTIAQAPIPELSLEELMHQFLGVSLKILQGQGPRPSKARGGENLQEIWFFCRFLWLFSFEAMWKKAFARSHRGRTRSAAGMRFDSGFGAGSVTPTHSWGTFFLTVDGWRIVGRWWLEPVPQCSRMIQRGGFHLGETEPSVVQNVPRLVARFLHNDCDARTLAQDQVVIWNLFPGLAKCWCTKSRRC